VKDEDILYEVPEGSTCIIPPPLSLTCKGINELHRRLIKNILIPHNKIGTEFLIFPRNRYNNYEGNNTKLSYSELISFIDRTGIPYFVYDTSTTKELSSQINLVQQAKVLVIPDGSAFLVNGLFASNSTIYVVGRLCSEEQSMLYPQIQYILNIIKRRNSVYWFKTCSEFIEFLKTGIYVQPIFKLRNATLESWYKDI
jgi:hypothetical protein